MELVEKAAQALERAKALGAELPRIFVELDERRIMAEAERQTARRNAGETLPLYGLTVSIKDLFDEAGARTSAASTLLAGRQPATRDAFAIGLLKQAGALCFGRTNMSEFAYSGVGLNPHHGTPGNIFDQRRVPGGSSSGAALSVAHGICDAAFGTDTGGSIRIPAAANGLYGFKPTASAELLEGVHALSPSYDSIGPLARDFPTMEAIAHLLGRSEPAPLPGKGLRLAICRAAFVVGAQQTVIDAFDVIVERLSGAGHTVETVALDELSSNLDVNRIIVSSEAYAQYAPSFARIEESGDANILRRIKSAAPITNQEIADARHRRTVLKADFAERLDGFDALIAPTLYVEPPLIAEVEADFDGTNGGMLRNASMINLVDGCAATIPVARMEMPPVGLMIAAPGGGDVHLLAAARRLDQDLQR